jgi:hypothetical protein
VGLISRKAIAPGSASRNRSNQLAPSPDGGKRFWGLHSGVIIPDSDAHQREERFGRSSPVFAEFADNSSLFAAQRMFQGPSMEIELISACIAQIHPSGNNVQTE